MPRGTRKVKLAITVDAAARRALLVRDGLAAVAEWEAEHGAFSERELAEAAERVRAQQGRSRRRPRARR